MLQKSRIPHVIKQVPFPPASSEDAIPFEIKDSKPTEEPNLLNLPSDRNTAALGIYRLPE